MRKDVHYQATYQIACKAGFSPSDAGRIARTAKIVDKEYPATLFSGVLSLFRNYTRYSRHFNGLRSRLTRRDSRDLWADYYLRRALETGDISYLGAGVHSLQDKVAHEAIFAQIDLTVFGRKVITTKWRDDPHVNREGLLLIKQATAHYLTGFLARRSARKRQ